MTRNDLLRMLLAAADDVDRSFDRAATVTWPPGALGELQRLGILGRAVGGMYATCPNCDEGHVEPVTALGERFYVSCPEAILVEVQTEMCERWQIDLAGLAAAVAGLLGLKGKPREVVADRFCRLGRTPWPPGSGSTREVVFACRMQDDDASAVAAHAGPGGRAVVLVPCRAPDDRIWPGLVPAVIPLSEVITWDGGELSLDVMAMVDAIETADRLAESSGAVALAPSGKKMVRRQVKAEIKSLLTDDAYVAAYKEHGSYRKAAEALSEQTGQPIGKDKVRRAIERHGGLAEVMPEMDSASVARRVASQRRDRQNKFLERR